MPQLRTGRHCRTPGACMGLRSQVNRISCWYSFMSRLKTDMGRSIQSGARALPVVNQVLGKGQVAFFKKALPANALVPVGQTLPWLPIFLVNVQYLLHHGGYL